MVLNQIETVMKTFKTDHIGSLKLNSTQFLTLCGQSNANFFQIFKAARVSSYSFSYSLAQEVSLYPSAHAQLSDGMEMGSAAFSPYLS